MDEASMVQKLTAEVIGTGFLVFVGVGSVPATLLVNGDAPFTMADLGMISLAFATVVVATVYALGHISGNHINPAVTLGLAVTGKFPWSRVPAYIAAQLVGATIGAAAILGVLGMPASQVGLGVAAFGAGVGPIQAFVAEFVGTFILVFTVFGVIHRKAAVGFAGLLVDPILPALDFTGESGVIAFVNGMGGTPLIELYLMYNEVATILDKAGIRVARSLVGPYITSLEMAGCSVTLLKVDDELLRLWDAPVRTPGLRWGL